MEGEHGPRLEAGRAREDAQSFDPEAQPAPAIDTKGRWHVELSPGATPSRPNRRRRSPDEPAPTMVFGHDSASWTWEEATIDDLASEVEALGEEIAALAEEVGVDDPAHWSHGRPSTTIVGSFHPEVVAPPGWRTDPLAPRQDTPGSVRITPAQAAILQSFPADYPWQGGQSKVFEQIGNAVPPRMAAAVVGALLGLDWPTLVGHPPPADVEPLTADPRAVWVNERPATSVTGDPRLSPPCHHGDKPGIQSGQAVDLTREGPHGRAPGA